MKFTLSWLHDHFKTDATPAVIADTLTHLGLEVESMEDKSSCLKPFIIAEVLACDKHPDADKLSLCKISDGKKTYQVVCGAANVTSGLKAVFAPIGAVMPRGQMGENMILKKGTIRGVESHGMLCSEYELCLGDDHDGIITLPADAPVGKNYASWAGLDDVLFEIKLTPNRADCLGVRGIARDLSASGLGTLKPLQPKTIKGTFASPIAWQIDEKAKQACPMVIGRYFKGVTNRPSPDWLKKKLLSVGMKSISALVDITNYLSQDMARPLHVFSGKKLGAGELTMRFANHGETIYGLDEVHHSLNDNMLVIANQKGAQSIAGIMGGIESGCQLDDDEIFLEVAYFNPMQIAKTGRSLNLLSDARYRFERGVDPMGLDIGLERASQLILDICGGEASTITTAGQPPTPPPPISFSPEKIKTYGGLSIKDETIAQTLSDLGFHIVKQKPNWQVTRPTWRGDIENDACLVEEVLRLHGFDKIPELPLPRIIPDQAIDEQGRRLMLIRRALANRGLYETITWSFTKQSLAEDFSASDIIKLQNPIHSDMDTMRPSVLCNLLLAVKRNQARGFHNIHLFESGLVFHGVTPEAQTTMIAGIRVMGDDSHWQKLPPLDSFVIKADIFSAIEASGFFADNLHINQESMPQHYHPNMAARLYLGKETIGYFGALHPALSQKYDIANNLFGFELFLEKIPTAKKQTSHARPTLLLNDLPVVYRDFAFVVDKNIAASLILATIKKIDKKFISQANIFDMYHDPKYPEKKSIAVRVTISPDDKTLSDSDIKTISEKIIAEVLAATEGSLRQ
ncbi:MAG: phenylalanine--tRNA ligase subunit beta [Alphaproteobacteria bacterium]